MIRMSIKTPRIQTALVGPRERVSILMPVVLNELVGWKMQELSFNKA